ncbi:MAG TPA: C25 family cysteine peptidase [Burkholderiaceae bacterium]|nr:C25 family cysteine peptidase [Burkholderiaceae bacterium]HMX09643.1 C25 family cysteine peptidase [Burkholderiaceae bacterium]HNG78611.1 C25 family cysteine peptidase [Burkholderiaceae bacterium]
MPVDKLLLSHRGALQAKYKAAGFKKIEAALKALVAADLKRGLTSQVIYLDDALTLKPLGAKAMTQAGDARQAKGAIDALYKQLAPHYLVLIGAPDVLPMVPLTNPAYSADGDGDRTVPSDLPYACAGAYSVRASQFLGPTRVVGRIPDLPGATVPTLLLQLLKAAAAARPLPQAEYQGYFGLSAEVWANSTALSLRNTFGADAAMHSAPPSGPAWSGSELAPRLHFINCHGADRDDGYYGQSVQDPSQYPRAHHAPLLAGKVRPGTVVAAECCYGAQLYDPKQGNNTQGIALTYLEQGAAAVFGSTTIAYGPSEGNGAADLITQYFLQRVLAGASLGRAVLEARLQFAGQRTHLDPYDLKTLAQFYLLGDPSLQPVAPSAHALTRTPAFKALFPANQDRSVRALRREKLERDGGHLQAALPKLQALAGDAVELPEAIAQALRSLARDSGMTGGAVRSFDLKARGRRAGGAALGQRRIHALAVPVSEGTQAGQAGHRVRAIVVTEQDGALLHVRRLHSR